MGLDKIAFLENGSEIARSAQRHLAEVYGNVPPEEADVIVALGGDGFMLETLQTSQGLDTPVYGMNCGTIGFLMNEYREPALLDRLEAAEVAVLNPLKMRAICADGTTQDALAINEVSVIRQGPQAAKLRVSVDGKERMAELVCDGALVSTPAGSTAYNYSAHGPILPIGADVLALTAMAAFRPRRWRGALLPATAEVRFDVLQPKKRPVRAEADSRAVDNVVTVLVRSETRVHHRILFDPGHGLEERLIREQFA